MKLRLHAILYPVMAEGLIPRWVRAVLLLSCTANAAFWGMATTHPWWAQVPLDIVLGGGPLCASITLVWRDIEGDHHAARRRVYTQRAIEIDPDYPTY